METKTTSVYLDRWNDALTRVQKNQSIRALMESQDSALRIAQAPAPELYYAIRQAGLSDALPILAFVQAEQFQSFIDFAAWSGDVFVHKEAASWLEALSTSSRDRLVEILPTLDQEWLVLFLRKYVTVFDSTDEVPEELHETGSVQASPDLQSVLHIRDAVGEGAICATMIDAMFSYDVIYGRRTLEACRAEIDVMLEEDALHFRNGRLEDLGFFPQEEAMHVYAARPAAAILREAQERSKTPWNLPIDAPHRTGIPSPYLAAFRKRGSLAALLGMPGAEDITARFLLELPPLLNRLLSARKTDPADAERIEELAQHLRLVLDLGVLHLETSSVEESLTRLRQLSLLALFQLGWSQINAIAIKARALLKHSAATWLSDAQLHGLQALSQIIPRVSLQLVGHEGVRDFQEESDLGLVRQLVLDAEASCALVQHLALAEKAPRAHAGVAPIEVSSLFCTAVANALLGRTFAPVPLRPAELTALRSALSTGLSADLLQQTRDSLATLPEETRSTAESLALRWLKHFVETVSALAEGEQDIRYLDTILFAANK